MVQKAKLSREEIEQRAQDVLERHGLLNIPVDPIHLAQKLGIKVHNAAFSEDDIAGMIRKKGTDILLLVKEVDPPFRKRFTIAHELGHHLLHHNQDEVVIRELDLYRSEPHLSPEEPRSSQPVETQANQFAAALLMPRTFVTTYYQKGLPLSALARLFNVSQAAMGIRLNQIGLI